MKLTLEKKKKKKISSKSVEEGNDKARRETNLRCKILSKIGSIRYVFIFSSLKRQPEVSLGRTRILSIHSKLVIITPYERRIFHRFREVISLVFHSSTRKIVSLTKCDSLDRLFHKLFVP